MLKEYLNTQMFIAKVVGLSTALGSGLPISKEGPFVHVASLALTFIGKGFRRFRGIYEVSKIFVTFHSQFSTIEGGQRKHISKFRVLKGLLLAMANIYPVRSVNYIALQARLTAVL